MRATKSELREHYAKRRKALTPEEALALDNQIFNRLLESFDFSRLATVHCFLPITAKREINTLRLIDRIRKDHDSIRIVSPRVEERGQVLRHYAFHPDQITTNSWGIPEPIPQEAKKVLESELDLVLVPLLAFDHGGHRVGYGKGFYDRFLANCSPGMPRVGLSQFDAVEEITDLHEQDLKMTACVTPLRVQWF